MKLLELQGKSEGTIEKFDAATSYLRKDGLDFSSHRPIVFVIILYICQRFFYVFTGILLIKLRSF